MRLYKLFVLFTIRALGLGQHGHHQRILVTPKLESQKSAPLEWKDYTFIIVGNKGSGEYGRRWGDKIAQETGTAVEDICAIASVSKWMTSTPGSQYIIRNSILLFENSVQVFIDWKEQFASSNDIDVFPTVLVVKYNAEDGSLLELGRVTGDYSPRKMRYLRGL